VQFIDSKKADCPLPFSRESCKVCPQPKGGGEMDAVHNRSSEQTRIATIAVGRDLGFAWAAPLPGDAVNSAKALATEGLPRRFEQDFSRSPDRRRSRFRREAAPFLSDHPDVVSTPGARASPTGGSTTAPSPSGSSPSGGIRAGNSPDCICIDASGIHFFPTIKPQSDAPFSQAGRAGATDAHEQDERRNTWQLRDPTAIAHRPGRQRLRHRTPRASPPGAPPPGRRATDALGAPACPRPGPPPTPREDGRTRIPFHRRVAGTRNRPVALRCRSNERASAPPRGPPGHPTTRDHDQRETIHAAQSERLPT